MILSIVTGTYNRKNTPRHGGISPFSNPVGIDHEFVVVDGGSRDGTIKWCNAQPDIVLIKHNELRGAIAAFCDGARAAQGDYVLLANDDIEFLPGSIMRAVTHLERAPHCGAVAFYDDRPAPGYGDGFKVQTMPAQTNGFTIDVPYAQVGLFRRNLGNACDWWGADDPAFPGHTYGGDNYLSAAFGRPDTRWTRWRSAKLRTACPTTNCGNTTPTWKPNTPAHIMIVSHVARCYPVKIIPARDTERLRVLYLPIYEPGPGTLQNGPTGRPGPNWAGLGTGLPQHPLRFVQYRRSVPTACPFVAGSQPARPVITQTSQRHANTARKCWWLIGTVDVYEEALTSPEMLAFLKHVDLQLTVNADVLPVYEQHGIPAAYWQVAFEPVDIDNLPEVATMTWCFWGTPTTRPGKTWVKPCEICRGSTWGCMGTGGVCRWADHLRFRQWHRVIPKCQDCHWGQSVHETGLCKQPYF